VVKVIEWEVICPSCDLVQSYHSHNKEVKGSRQKKCNRCGHSFACRKRRLSKLPDKKRKLYEDSEVKGSFHSYSRK